MIRCRLPGGGRFVTTLAGCCDVRTIQGEFRLPVRPDGEGRWMEALHGVALIAAVLIRTSRELFCVRVLVAISATAEGNLVFCGLASRLVAHLAFQARVPAEQWIAAALVVGP